METIVFFHIVGHNLVNLAGIITFYYQMDTSMLVPSESMAGKHNSIDVNQNRKASYDDDTSKRCTRDELPKVKSR